ncbi:hypothetical protein [Streptomyces sp. NBC_00539]|uniref:hypothetical protein n=1 Tax=Streptomyces sp. NBC_00539 TaxID=2975770 RepID=UPI002E80B7C8|nr:hypothetical protein [Streptomyces sp. NBC_00539]WUC69204.1 hypothetical protein OG861_33750 [Streptomyces sp. NBC_00539]
MRIHHALTLLTVAGILALTACNSDSTASPDPSHSWVRDTDVNEPTTPVAPGDLDAATRADLERLVRAYSGHYFAGNGAAAYEFLSQRCTTKVGGADVFIAIVQSSAKAYGPQEIQTLTIDQLVGDMARVSYTYSVPKLNQQAQPWVREAGAWRYDGC